MVWGLFSDRLQKLFRMPRSPYNRRAANNGVGTGAGTEGRAERAELIVGWDLETLRYRAGTG